jgi:UPF0716 protein FxsA
MRLILLLYPWLELLSLIQLGIEAGALVAIAWVLGMFMLGSVMLRHVGMTAVMRLREAQRNGVLQQTLFVDDFAVAFAGLLLMIPGLLSDFFALLVLVGPLRRGLARWIVGKPVPDMSEGFGSDPRSPGFEHNSFSGGNTDPVTLEGDFKEVSSTADKPGPPKDDLR